MTDKESKRNRILAVILLFVFFIGGQQLTKLELSRRAAKAADAYPISRDVFLLDTYCSLTTYEGGGKEALSAAVEALNKYDDMINFSKEGSDIYRINHRETSEVDISEETAEILLLEREFCELTGGVLEPAIKPVTELWDFKEEKKVPDEKELKSALSKVKSLKWDVSDGKFIAYDADVRLDVGASAKGFIADKIKEVLIENGVTSGIINLGGNVLCIGHKPDGGLFSVAVYDPEHEDSYAFSMEIDDTSVVTAGAYERYFIEDGIRYHHIIDPSTGFPAQTGLESVTIVGPESGICDCLSTSLFIMGEERGKA
ncbi:MAG: FAD:protein FMN transferase, partial [Eubacteriales bacterium]|nr:FAD:protein FMN transferase [Eubacteriales bacterium]